MGSSSLREMFAKHVCLVLILLQVSTLAAECKDKNAEDLGEGCVCKKNFIVKYGKCAINPTVCYMIDQALTDLQETTQVFLPQQAFSFRSAAIRTPGDLTEEELATEEPTKRINGLQKLLMLSTMFPDDMLYECGFMCGCKRASQVFLGGKLL